MIPLPVHGKTPISRGVVPTRVLVVDSEPLIRWSICAALAAEGFDAIAAADTIEAARLATARPPPRVVLLDLRKPDADAADLVACRAVYPASRFVIMTTERHAAGLDAASSNGVEVIEKPFDLARVVASVTRLSEAEPYGVEP